MATPQLFLTTAQGPRRFACSAVAVQAIILKADARLLLLSSPTRNRPDEWQIISGGLEAAATVLNGVLREVKEEVGPQMQVRPLGVVHAQTFHYIRFLQHPVCSLCYDGLLAMVHHRGGDACSEHLVGHGGPG